MQKEIGKSDLVIAELNITIDDLTEYKLKLGKKSRRRNSSIALLFIVLLIAYFLLVWLEINPVFLEADISKSKGGGTSEQSHAPKRQDSSAARQKRPENQVSKQRLNGQNSSARQPKPDGQKPEARQQHPESQKPSHPTERQQREVQKGAARQRSEDDIRQRGQLEQGTFSNHDLDYLCFYCVFWINC